MRPSRRAAAGGSRAARGATCQGGGVRGGLLQRGRAALAGCTRSAVLVSPRAAARRQHAPRAGRRLLVIAQRRHARARLARRRAHPPRGLVLQRRRLRARAPGRACGLYTRARGRTRPARRIGAGEAAAPVPRKSLLMQSSQRGLRPKGPRRAWTPRHAACCTAMCVLHIRGHALCKSAGRARAAARAPGRSRPQRRPRRRPARPRGRPPRQTGRPRTQARPRRCSGHRPPCACASAARRRSRPAERCAGGSTGLRAAAVLIVLRGQTGPG
jgi:hypothetical protein